MSDTVMPLGVTAVMLPELDLDEQIELCVEAGLTHYSVRPRVIPEQARDQAYSSHGNHKFDLTPQRLAEQGRAIGKKLADAGLTAWGTLPKAGTTADDDTIKLNLEGAAAIEAGCMRVAVEPYGNKPFDYAAQLEKELDRYAHIIELAEPFGLKIVIETHCRSLATSPALALNLCRPFDPSQIGVIFDLANFNREGAVTPQLAVSVLGDYIDHVHIGGARFVPDDYDASGSVRYRSDWCAMSESVLHLPDWLAALHQAGRDVPLIIEDFTANIPAADKVRQGADALRRMMAGL